MSNALQTLTDLHKDILGKIESLLPTKHHFPKNA